MMHIKDGIITAFDRVQDIPGYESLADNQQVDVINFLHNHINDVDLCLQSIKYNSSNIMVYTDEGDMVSAAGWEVTQLLGKGKDGITFLGYRHSDPSKSINTVKCLSKYAKQYSNHTELFSSIYNRASSTNDNIFNLHIGENCTYYSSKEPLLEVTEDNFDSMLPTLCKLNSWCIVNTGFAFWDFGFGSGKNYMLDNGLLKWIDYGGAGLVKCPNFKSIYAADSTLPEIYLSNPFSSKASLVNANSDFLMCQFLLHVEYWKNKNSTNADIWSSMLQIRKSVVDEFLILLPTLLTSNITQKVYVKFKDRDWTNNKTWKQIGKYINENT
jgi:hypothetical protein